ncbi:MAG TPA: hypothetical protein VFV23_05225 [Verrucomicrobiae bacterium]|nr:hypothetical protein [Verrucomicrobiae bacterium]
MLPNKPTQKDVNEWLDAIFSAAPLGKEKEYYQTAITAFENLTYYFIHRQFGANKKLIEKLFRTIRIDYVAVTSTLKRFQRDVYGVKRFDEITTGMVKGGKFTAATKDLICKEVSSLGLRVTADSPRKTRESAGFSLWMCVFRPISFNSLNLPEISPENLEVFSAMVNYFIASSYLGKFGNIVLGHNGHERQIRVERIKHDFTFREVSFSTLETFYGAIFQCDSDD